MAVEPTLTSPRGRTLLERGGELAALEELGRRASVGRGGVAALLGPAGIGKTSLLDAARARARAGGVSVLSARGGELEHDFPFGVVRQLLERPLRALGPAQRASVLDGAARPAAAALGLSGAAADAQFDVVHGLYWACANLAAREPMLIVVDDAHWADGPSLRFLAYLARRVEELPLSLVVAARPGTEGADLLQSIAGAPGTIVLEPSPLTEKAVAELVTATFGDEAGQELVRACRDATVGNPFLCRALLTALADRAELPAPAAVAEVAGRSISARIVARLGRLPPAAVELARAVAVLGADADLRHAVALAGLDEDSAAAAIDALVAQHILRVGRPLEFVHPLVRAAVADAIPPAARLRAHARAARLLADVGAEPDAVAAQLMHAEPAGDAWVVEALEQASELATRRGVPEAAASYLRRAVEEAPPSVPLLRRLAAAEIACGNPAGAAARLEEAQRVSADAAIGHELAVALVLQGDYAGAARVAAAALKAGRPDEDLEATLRAQLLQIETLEPGAFAVGDLRPPGLEDPLLRRPTRGSREYLAALTTHATLRLRTADEATRAARRAFEAGINEELVTGMAWPNTIYPTVIADDFDLAETILSDAFERIARTRPVVGVARAYGARAMLHLRRGALREAVADGHVATRTSREAGLFIWVIGFSALLEALVEQGDLEGATAVLDETGQADGPLPQSFLHQWVLHARGRLRLAQGRRDAAIADFEEGLRRGERRALVNPAVAPFRSSLALALGPGERAAALAAEELDLARRWGAPRAIGLALRRLALTRGNDENALALLRESADSLEPVGAHLEHALSLIELGAALRRANRRAEAREPLHRGMELAERCGALPLVARAREELVATGARPRRIMRTGVDALTASELRVARMAAEGLTNREIAQALYVTLRTVELHLTHAYQKLDIAGRDGLIAVLAP